MRASSILRGLPLLVLLAPGCDAPRSTGGTFDPDASLKKDDVPATPEVDVVALPDVVAPSKDIPTAVDVVTAADVVTPPADVPTDTGPACDPGRTLCAGVCVDTAMEPTHCGACGRACEGGQRCEMGACVTACESPRQRCGTACVDPQTDVSNCGACGRACMAGANATARCEAGVCGLTCATGFGDCDGDAANGCETNLAESLANCGRCGAVCPGGSFAVCAMGACATRCMPGQTLCGETCADILSSQEHCGACGNRCGTAPNATGRCSLGACALTCATGFGDCDRDPGNGCETDLRTSTSHCGACGTACAAPPGGAPSCAAGVCGAVCPSGQILCGGACVNPQTDNNHCGACGNACGTRSMCGGGTCSIPVPTTRYVQQGSPQTFIDACSVPGRLTYLAGADDAAVRVSLPFAFRYWTTDLAANAQINLTSNGWIGMLGDTAADLGGTLPNASAPNGVIAAYWRDNYNRSPGMCVATVGTAPNRQWVVEWQNQYHYGSGSESLTYEIVLSETTNTIDLVYQTMSGVGSGAVGSENAAGTAGVGGCPGGGTICGPTSGYRTRFAPAP